jgi:hypothetical protein
MSKRIDETGTAPMAALSPAERSASYSLPAALGAAPLPRSVPASGVVFVSQRNEEQAIDEVDRPFFLWLLAGLIAATATCGLIAMSAVLAIAPVVE